jgi:hypothetical protein
MAKDLSNLWRNFSLPEEESLEVEATKQGLHYIAARGRSCLVGKLLADCLIGKDAIKATLIRGQKPTRTTILKNLGENLFLVEFEHVWDKSRVLEGRPWVIKGNMFLLKISMEPLLRQEWSLKRFLFGSVCSIFHWPVCVKPWGSKSEVRWDRWRRLRWTRTGLTGDSFSE